MDSCTGCKHHIGAGLCRMNLEDECGAGGHEAYEPREERAYSRAEFLEAAVSCGWGTAKAAKNYVAAHPKATYSSDDLMQLRREDPDVYEPRGRHGHTRVTYGQIAYTTKRFKDSDA